MKNSRIMININYFLKIIFDESGIFRLPFDCVFHDRNDEECYDSGASSISRSKKLDSMPKW